LLNVVSVLVSCVPRWRFLFSNSGVLSFPAVFFLSSARKPPQLMGRAPRLVSKLVLPPFFFSSLFVQAGLCAVAFLGRLFHSKLFCWVWALLSCMCLRGSSFCCFVLFFLPPPLFCFPRVTFFRAVRTSTRTPFFSQGAVLFIAHGVVRPPFSHSTRSVFPLFPKAASPLLAFLSSLFFSMFRLCFCQALSFLLRFFISSQVSPLPPSFVPSLSLALYVSPPVVSFLSCFPPPLHNSFFVGHRRGRGTWEMKTPSRGVVTTIFSPPPPFFLFLPWWIIVSAGRVFAAGKSNSFGFFPDSAWGRFSRLHVFLVPPCGCPFLFFFQNTDCSVSFVCFRGSRPYSPFILWPGGGSF